MKIRTTPKFLALRNLVATTIRRHRSAPLQTWYKGLSPNQVDPVIRNHLVELEGHIKEFARIDRLKTTSGLAVHLLILGGFSALLVFSVYKIILNLSIGPGFGFSMLGLFSGFAVFGLIKDLFTKAHGKPLFLPHQPTTILKDEDARLLVQVFRNYPRIRQHAQYGEDYGNILQRIDLALVNFIRFNAFDREAFQQTEGLFASEKGASELRHLREQFPVWWES